MLRIPLLTTLCTRFAVRNGSFPRGRARCFSASARTLVNSGEATKAAIPESSVHKNNSGVESQFGPHGKKEGEEKMGAVEERNENSDLQHVMEETAGEAIPYQKRRHSPEAALTTRLKGLVPAAGAGPWRLAVHMLEKGRMDGINDVKAYNVVFKMMVMEERVCDEKLKEIQKLFCQMKLDGLEPEVPTYNSVIYGYGLARDGQGALRVYNEMVSKGLQPDQRTMSNMIFAHSWGSLEDMRRFVSEMQAKGWRRTRRANNAAISALGRVKDWNGIIEITKVMLENGQKLSEASFTFAIKAAAFQGEVDFARKLLAVRNAVHFKPREELYVSVMVALRNAERNHECLACWRELVLLNGLGDVIVNEKTYNLVLRVAVKIEEWDEMEVILDMMQEKNAVLSEETYLAVLDARNAEKWEYITRLERVLDAVQRRNMAPSGRVLLSAAMAYARAERWQKAMTMFNQAVTMGCILDRRATENLVQALVALEKYAEVKEFWARRYNAPGGVNSLCAGTLQRMATAARELGDADWGMELLSVSQNNGRSGTGVCEEMATILTTSGIREAATMTKQEVMEATDTVGHNGGAREDALRTPSEALALATMAQDKNGKDYNPSQLVVEAEGQDPMRAKELLSCSRYNQALR